jgi:uncharacterized protein
MPEVTSYTAGMPSWVDLATSDPEGARSFYGRLLGWEFEIGAPEAMHYTNCTVNGKNVAGMGGDPAPEGTPTGWTTYMAADDVDAVAKRITDNGGQLMLDPMDVMEHGRMLVAIDPTGAVFGAWEARSHTGASLVNEPGAVTWNELATRDLETAQKFYGAVFGYGGDDVDTGGGPLYRTFSVEGRPVGGAMQIPDDWPSGTPSHWMVYFEVADVDAAASEAERLGGGVMEPPRDSPYGRWTVLRDPQGGVFTAMKSAWVPAE